MGRALLLALVLVLALPMAAAGAPTSGSGAADPPRAASGSLQDVAILTMNGSSRASFATASLDVGTVLAMRHDAASARLDRYALDERFQATDATEARQALLFESATAVEIRIAALRSEEQALRAAYADREVSPEAFVRGLVLIDARAARLQDRLAAIQGHAQSVPEFSMNTRIQLLEAALSGLSGPVRARAGAAMGGEGPTRLFVDASDSGVVLSTIHEGRFVREAYRDDRFDRETVTGTSFGEALAITERLYAPFAYNQSLSVRNELVGPEGGIFQFTMEFQEGSVTAWLDGGTQAVFFEVQERRLNLLGERPSVTGAANGTRLVVNRSYPGGPLRVVVTDNETGTPRQVPVVVEGARFETGTDGTLWTLSPAAPFEVTAVGPEGNVTVAVRPFAPTPVAAEG